MSHHHTHHIDCDKQRKFHDTVGKGKHDSTYDLDPMIPPKGASNEIGSDTHPGPFYAQAFNKSGIMFFGLAPRRNTPNQSPEKGGKVLMDDKRHDNDRFYKPRIKDIKNTVKKKHHHK